MSDTRNRLEALLRERILVLDGAWGTMLQRAGLEDADYRGERFADHPRDVAGDPDLLNLTRPDVVLDIHRRYLAAGADITTTNTFTATSIGQADYGLEGAVHEHERRGRAAGAAGGGRGRRPLRRRLARAAERDALALAEGRRSRLPRRHLRPGRRVVLRADPGPPRGRRRPAPDRDDLRHAEREGGDRRGQGRRARAAALDLGHDRRPLRPHALRPDRRGLLELDRGGEAADRGRQLLARARRRCGRMSQSSPGSPARTRARIRTPGCRTPSAATTSSRTTRPSCSARSRARASSTSSAAAAARRRSTRARSPRPSTGCRRGELPERPPGRASAASSRSRSAPTPAS